MVTIKFIKGCLVGLAILGLSACGRASDGFTSSTGVEIGAVNTPAEAKYAVKEVRVSVPDTLKVSEANLYYPIADIVWRGDPPGDRHEQVRTIVREAAERATAGMDSGNGVIVDIEVTRFHALTEKARITIGGVYSLRFDLSVRDAATGAIIEEPRKIIADAPASGGEKAFEEDREGRTERVVITEHLANVIRAELSRPISSPQF